jgi:hypothetical protein
MSEITTTWPPTEDQIISIASSALNQSQDKDVKVLVYWENDPTLMIFDPFHFADTKYIKKKFAHNERTVLVTIGKID